MEKEEKCSMRKQQIRRKLSVFEDEHEDEHDYEDFVWGIPRQSLVQS